MLISSARFVCAASDSRQFPKKPLPEIAFLGRSNVGKSSLINSLLRTKQLARTSSTPGRTQSINFYEVNESFRFVDLPGYGWAKVSRQVREQWRHLAENYLAKRESLVLCVCVVDSRHEPADLDHILKSWLEFHKLPFIVVATKSDKLSASELRSSLSRAKAVLATESVIAFSAVKAAGARQIWEEIVKNIKGSNKS